MADILPPISLTVHFSGVKLYVDTEPQAVLPVRGGNATLSCRYWYDPELSTPRRVRVKWSWLPVAGGQEEEDVLVAIGPRSRSFGDFRLLVVVHSWSLLLLLLVHIRGLINLTK